MSRPNTQMKEITVTEPIDHIPGNEEPTKAPIVRDEDWNFPDPKAGKPTEPEQQLYDQEEAEHQAQASGENVDGPPKPGDEGGDPDDDRGPEDFPRVVVGGLDDLLDYLAEKVAEATPERRFVKPDFEKTAQSFVDSLGDEGADPESIRWALESAFEEGRQSVLDQSQPVPDEVLREEYGVDETDELVKALNDVGAITSVQICKTHHDHTALWTNAPVSVIVDLARKVYQGGGVPAEVVTESVLEGEVEGLASSSVLIEHSTVTINNHFHA